MAPALADFAHALSVQPSYSAAIGMVNHSVRPFHHSHTPSQLAVFPPSAVDAAHPRVYERKDNGVQARAELRGPQRSPIVIDDEADGEQQDDSEEEGGGEEDGSDASSSSSDSTSSASSSTSATVDDEEGRSLGERHAQGKAGATKRKKGDMGEKADKGRKMEEASPPERVPHIHRKKGRVAANDPIGHDDSGNPVWEVKELLRSDVDAQGRTVYKCSWWNWTGWPRYTWITREEWMGEEAELRRFEERESRRAKQPKRMRASKYKKHAITPTTSWAHDQQREKEWQETCRRKKERDLARANKGAAHSHGKQAKGGKKKVGVKREGKEVEKERAMKVEEGEKIFRAKPQRPDENEEDSAEAAGLRAERKREQLQQVKVERKRRRQEELERVVPHVRAGSRFLVPWSSDDDNLDDLENGEEGEGGEGSSDEQMKQRLQLMERRRRRRTLRLFALSEFELGRSLARPMKDSEEAEKSGEEEGKNVEKEEGVVVHVASELTGSDSEAEMELWKEERRYRVDRIADHRPEDEEEGWREREERLRKEEQWRKMRSERQQRAQRQSVFERVQRVMDEGAGVQLEQAGGGGQSVQWMTDGGEQQTGEEDDEDEKEEVDREEELEEHKEGRLERRVRHSGVDKAAGVGYAGGGSVQYRLRWTGHGERATSWEREEQLRGCEQLLRPYKALTGLAKSHGKKGAKRR